MFRIIAALARRAEAYGYRVRALFLEDGPLRLRLEEEGVSATAVAWNGTRSDVVGMVRTAYWLRRNPAEVAHIHHGGRVLRSLCRWAGAGAVAQHVHGEVLEPELSSVAKLGFRGADAVIACSRAAAEALRNCKPELIYAGIAAPDEMPPSASANGPLRLGMLARLVPLKRADTVVEATARLAAMGVDVQTEICGTGPEESSLRGLAVRLGVAERVTFLGWREDAAALLASWHVLVLPSMTEGLPIAVLEAMAAGRAVVASRVGGLTELVEDGETGRLIAPGDVDALTAGIVGLAENREELVRLGENGWRRVRVEFSDETMAEKITALYDRLLGGGGRTLVGTR